MNTRPPHARRAGERLAGCGHSASGVQFAEAHLLPALLAAHVNPLM